MSLLELILTKKNLIFLKLSIKYLDTLRNLLINWLKKVESKVPDATGLSTTAALSAKICEFENKIIDVSGLVKKTDYGAKISDIKGKYFTNPDYNKFMSDILDVETKHKELVDKSNIPNCVKNSHLNSKLKKLATKAIKSSTR